jgi:hypothetical protein
MRRATMVLLLLLGSAAFLSVCTHAIELTEVGIQVHLMHDPLLSDGDLRLGVGIGGYCKLAVADGWTMRAELGNPLEVFYPQFGLAVTYALGDRFAVEGQLRAQTDFRDLLYVSVNAGGRMLLAGSETSRLVLSSFPFALAGFRGWQSEMSFLATAAANAHLDYSWVASEHVILGQAIGVSLARLGPDAEMALPLGEIYGVMIDSITHAGYRP